MKLQGNCEDNERSIVHENKNIDKYVNHFRNTK